MACVIIVRHGLDRFRLSGIQREAIFWDSEHQSIRASEHKHLSLAHLMAIKHLETASTSTASHHHIQTHHHHHQPLSLKPNTGKIQKGSTRPVTRSIGSKRSKEVHLYYRYGTADSSIHLSPTYERHTKGTKGGLHHPHYCIALLIPLPHCKVNNSPSLARSSVLVLGSGDTGGRISEQVGKGLADRKPLLRES